MFAPTLVFHTAVENYWWLTFAYKMQTQVVAMSPPCPPWSNAGSGGGLCKPDGCILLISVLVMCFLCPRMWTGENVSALRAHQHCHWPVIAAAIKWSGFDLAWTSCMDLLDHIPQHRDRLLMIARNCRDEDLENHRPISWPIAPKQSLDSYGALLVLGGFWKTQSELTREEVVLYLDPKHAPNSFQGTQSKKARKDVAQYRLKTGDDTVAFILTSYGRPHSVPEDARNRSGLFGSLILKGNTIRKLTIPEIVILFGTVKPCWLPAQVDVATTLLGNAIALPQVLIALLNTVSFIRPLWHGDNIQMTFASICSEHLSKDNLAICQDEDGFWFRRADKEEEEVALQ